MELKRYQELFLDLLIATDSLRFGDFVLKSGRKSPYFIDLGNTSRSGLALDKMGRLYAQHMHTNLDLKKVDILFGPPYKGIPLTVATAIDINNRYGINLGVSFSRKEAKSHGEEGVIIGTPIENGKNIVIIDDVLTDSKTKKDTIEFLNGIANNLTYRGIVVGVDRQEVVPNKNTGRYELARDVFEDETGIHVYPIVTFSEMIIYLKEHKRTSSENIGRLEQRLTEINNQVGTTV